MAIDAFQFNMIAGSGVQGKALSAGYPDLLLERSDALPDKFWTVREDSQRVASHHGIQGPIYDSHDVFLGMGLNLFVIDRAVLQGTERVVDLNEPQDLGEFDLVIDPGTIEHCFNIAQAAKNLAEAVKVGGVISQAVPMSMFNHGYYNLNPIWFHDFYSQNGFDLEQIALRRGPWVMPNVGPERMRGVEDGTVVLVLARRTEKKTIQWPQQR